MSPSPVFWIAVLISVWLSIHPSWCDFASLSLTTHLPSTRNSSHEVTVNSSMCAFYNPTYVTPPYQSYPRLDHFHHAIYPSDGPEMNYGCSPVPSNISNAPLQNSILLVDRGKCSFHKKAWLAQEQGVSLLVVIYNESQLTLRPRLVPTDMPNMTTTSISIPVLFVMNSSGEKIKSWLFNSTAVYLNGYATSRPSPYSLFDPAIIVVFAIASATLMLSVFLSYNLYEFLWYGLLFRPETRHLFTLKSSTSESRPLTSELLDMAWIVVVSCCVILLLYFFHTATVQIILLFYCLLAVLGLYHVLSPFMALIPFGNGDKFRVPPSQLPILKYRPSVMFFITVAFCVAVTLFWLVYRHSSYVWILHNILGFTMMCRFMYYHDFDKVWVLTIFMVLIFFYDIFMVFITPYFTSDGISVMERAVLGEVGGSSEKLPIVFYVPTLMSLSPQDSACAAHFGMKRSFLLLGYGDVYVPGLLVVLALKFDHKNNPDSIKLYYFTSSIAYMLGLICTFCAMVMTQVPQPALLYLVPTTLGSVLILSLLRSEFYLFFFGKRRKRKRARHDEEPTEPQHKRRCHHGKGSRRRRRGHH